MFKKELKKNFLRVKQQMDQNLGRAEKTEVLSEDLVHLEKKVENIKQTFQSTSKKIASTLPGLGTDVDKRLKKIPQWGVQMSLVEASSTLGSETLLGNMFHSAAEAQGILAKEHLQLELEMEHSVLTPFHQILENDIPAINKLRKNLARMVLDMDSARSRYHAATRQSTAPGTNKTENIKDEMEDAQIRVDQCRDQLATEMYNFVSRESEFCGLLVQLVNEQAQYHKRALQALEDVIPKMNAQLEQCAQMPVFGQPLEDHLRRTSRDIATVIETCVCVLIEEGMEEEGLFRVAGPASKVKKLKAAFDSGGPVEVEEYDVHCMAGALKQYLRELPDPLLTYGLYQEWRDATNIGSADQKLQALWLVLDKLPQPNYNNLRYLIKFLAKLAEQSDMNKMSPSNIAIVIGPNLIWPPGDSGPNMFTTSTLSAIAEQLVTHADWFFPGDLEFASTNSLSSGPTPLVSLPNSNNNSQDGLSNQGYNDAAPIMVTSAPSQLPYLPQPAAASVPVQPPSPQMSAHNSQPNMAAPPPGQNNLPSPAYDQQLSGSPVPPRRTAKKPAPPPPAERNPGPPTGMDRPSMDRPSPTSEKSFPIDKPLGVHTGVGVLDSVHGNNSFSGPVTTGHPFDRPPIPDRPLAPPPAPPSEKHEPTSPRPKGPPPDRPVGPPPEKLSPPKQDHGHQRTPSGSKLIRPHPPPPPPPHRADEMDQPAAAFADSPPTGKAPVAEAESTHL